MGAAQPQDAYDPERVFEDAKGKYRLSRFGGRIPADEFRPPPVLPLWQLMAQDTGAEARTRSLIGRLKAIQRLQKAAAQRDRTSPLSENERRMVDECNAFVDRAWAAFHGREPGSVLALTLMEALQHGGQRLKATGNVEDGRVAALKRMVMNYPEHVCELAGMADFTVAIACWARSRGNPGADATRVDRFEQVRQVLRKLGEEPPTAQSLKDAWKKA